MVQSSSKKKRIAIALVVIFAIMIFGGVGIGVYFFINNKDSGSGLSKKQIAFGTVINNFDSSPVLSRKDFSTQYSGSVQNVVCYSDDFLAFVEDGEINFVSLSQNQQINIDLEFDELVAIYGKIAHVKKDGISILLNLETKNKVASFSNASIYRSGNFVLIKAFKNSTFEYFENSQTETLTSLILKVSSGEKEFSSKLEDDIIDVYFEENFAVIISSCKTLACSLCDDFSKILEFQNVCDSNSVDFNIESSLSSKTFFMTTFYKLNELSKKSLLVEKTVLASNNENSVKLITTNGERHYEVEYNVYDTDLKAFALLSAKGFLVTAQKCEFSDSYVAVVKSEILNDGTISENQTIEYYYLNSNKVSKDTFKLEKIISYDFLKFGKIVGYEKGNLLTKGGTMSGVIDFSGKQVSSILTSAGETAESQSWQDSAIVFSSITGLKGVKNSKGEILFEAKYDKISPTADKFMVAKISDKFFVLCTDGTTFEISKFATEFEDYVFSGIGFFFTKAGEGKYNVYKLDKTLYKSEVSVRILEKENGCALCIGEDELFDVEFVNGVQNKNLEIQKTGSFSLLSTSRSFTGTAQNVADDDENLEFSSINTDKTTGAGLATIKKSLSESELSNLQFISYSNLSVGQKALIPTFDDQDKMSYLSSSGSIFNFDGAFFWSNENVVIALVRLKKEGTEEFSFFVNIALKNAYLKQAVVSGLKGSETSNFVWFDTEKKSSFDSSSKTVAPMNLNSKVVLFDETTTSRQMDFSSSGFDGGIVFVSDSQIKNIDISITISNIFASSQNSEIYSFDESQTYESENYVITVDKDSRKVTLSAKSGYAFKSASFVALEANSIVQTGDETLVGSFSEYAKSVTVDFSSSSKQYFKISNMEIIEEYSKLILKDFEGSMEDAQTAYYFYGYGDEISTTRNPAPFGFENFKRKTKIGVYSRTGYTFDGFFAPNSTEILAINQDGEFVGNSTMFVATSQTNEFELNAKYTAKEYEIIYEKSGVQLSGSKKVTFDSPVGELLTESDIGAVEGYEFMGWEYQGNLITAATVYQYDENIKVKAKYSAKQWTLYFDSNVDTYSSGSIKGYDYEISKAKFVQDFGGEHAGDEFSGSISKTITYNEKFGELPLLVGEGTSGKSYSFVCWSDSKTYSVSGENITYGNVYTSENVVNSDPPVSTLYAHYVKDVYRVDIVDNGEDLVEKDGNVVSHFEKIRFEGASQNGTKKNFSTMAETGFELLSKTGGKYETFTVDGENYVLSLFANEGYFVSKITVLTSKGVFILTGSMTDSGFVLNGSTQGFSFTTSGKNVTLLFDAFETLKVDDNQRIGATITVETGTITFDNNFTVSDATIKRDSEFEATANKKDEGLIYASTNTYEIVPIIENQFAKNVLKSLTFNGEKISFELEYKEDNGQYYNVLVAGKTPESSVVEGNNIVKTYGFTNAKLKVSYNTVTKLYSYFLEITQFEDCEISVEMESISVNVKVEFSNTSTDDEKTDGMNAKVGGTSISSGEEKNVNPSQETTFTFSLKNQYYLMEDIGLVLAYGGTSYNIFGFTDTNDFEQRIVTQTGSIVASESVFTRNESTMTCVLKGTNIEISFDKTTGVFTVKVLGAYQDVSLRLQYHEYKFVSISSLSSDAFTLTVNAGSLSGNIDDLLTTDILKFKNNNSYNYIIHKNESTIKGLKLETKISESNLFRIVQDSAENFVLNQDNTQATVTFDENTHSAYCAVSAKTRTLSFTSFVCTGTDSNGDEIYSEDPVGSNDVLTKATVEYVDGTGASVSKAYNGKFNISFYGTKLTITISEISKCELKSYKMKKAGTETEITCSVSGNSYVFELDSSMGDAFDFELYFAPYRFNVKFDLKGNASASTSPILNSEEEKALLGDQTAFWDIPFNIPDVELEMEGYQFKGYALSADGLVYYDSGETVYDNFNVDDDEMTSEKEITLYAVWEQNAYTIKFVVRDSQSEYKYGSTTSSSVSNISVEFDKEFTLQKPTRVGYTFAGWWTKVTGTETSNDIAGEMLSKSGSLVLSKELFDKLTVDGTQIVLYANWNARTMNISFNKNDKDNDNGSTLAEGTLSDISVVFDSGTISSLPTLSREGYEFVGFNSSAIKAGQTAGKENLTAGSVLDNTLLENCGFVCDENTETLQVYAVWKNKEFRVYVDAQKDTLVGHKDNDETLKFEITNWSNKDSTGYYSTIYFDKEFGIVPNVVLSGYDFRGVFPSATSGDEIETTTIVDSAFINKIAEINETTFKIFAQYEKHSYTVNVEKGGLESISPNDTKTKEFYEDITFNMLTGEGQYLKSVEISSAGETITINFAWDSYEKEVSIGSIVSTTSENITKDNSTSIYKNLTFTSTIDSSSKNNVDITIEKIKASFKFSVKEVVNQQYQITVYTSANGTKGQGQHNEKYGDKQYDFKVGYELSQDGLLNEFGYPFLKGYKFKEFRFATKSGTTYVPDNTTAGAISVTRTLKENKVIVAVYEESLTQGVHFYFWDGSSYVERDSSKEFFMYWYEGSKWSENSTKFDTTSGKIKELPSIGSYLWPDNTVHCGFAISSSAPSSYLKKSSSSSLTEFTCSTMIEDEINVYAVYDEQYFIIVNSDSTLTSSYNLYQEIGGAYVKVESEVKYFKFSSVEDKNNFKKYVEEEDDTCEVALTKVSVEEATTFVDGNYYVAVIMGANDEYYWVSTNILGE